MQSALDQFHISIGRVRDLISLQSAVQAQSTKALDVSDMLRAALVLTVSALDYYIHEVVVLGMIEIHRGQRLEPTPSANVSRSAFSRFRVSLGGARTERELAINLDSWIKTEIEQNEGYEFLEKSHTVSSLISVISNRIRDKLNDELWLESEIREQLGYQSFQQADKIADAVRYISDKRLWEEVGLVMGTSAKDLKKQLSSIVDRRNKIAHEADINPTLGLGIRWEIEEQSVKDAVDFIEQLVEAIHRVL